MWQVTCCRVRAVLTASSRRAAKLIEVEPLDLVDDPVDALLGYALLLEVPSQRDDEAGLDVIQIAEAVVLRDLAELLATAKLRPQVAGGHAELLGHNRNETIDAPAAESRQSLLIALSSRRHALPCT